MFNRIKLRFSDMGTIKALCLGAEKQAHKNGEEAPGAEHFLLSAMDLPDGTARRVFERLGIESDALGSAIAKQYRDALSSIGVDPSNINVCNEDPEPITSNRILFDSKPSGQAVMKGLVDLRVQNKDIPLLGVHVVEVVASMQEGVAARSLRAMGVDSDALCVAVKEELNEFCMEEGAPI